MKIDQIISEIKKNTGIIRMKPVTLDSPEKALPYYQAIGDALLSWKKGKFEIDKVKDQVFSLVNWTYMLDDSIDYTKGILFKGHTGTGKTLLMKVFREALKLDSGREDFGVIINGEKCSIIPEFANARVIAGEYSLSASGGYDVISRYSRIPVLMIDDIGAETKTQLSYGNRVSVISEIIDRRNECNMLTFGTTNLNKMADKNGYDDRTARRMREMFNVISFNGDGF